MEKPTLIQFLKSAGIYNAGEVAGFSAADAQKYVDGGWAAPCDPAGKIITAAAAETPISRRRLA